MFLPNLSISRPVTATMICVALITFGLIGYNRLPVREFPDVDPPIVSVTTIYPGAAPEVVESEVTEVIEEELNTIEGIKSMTSQSREQVSSITIEFVLNRDVDIAAQDVRDKIARIRGRLPDDIEAPIVAKQDADASPIMWVALYSDSLSPLDLTDIAENMYKDRVQNIEGVGRVIIGGAQRFAVRVRMDADKLAAHRITVADVVSALESQHVEIPSGRIEGAAREFTIRTEGEFPTPEAFNRLVVAYRDEAPVRLGDVGHVESGVEDERTLARFLGRPAVGLGIVKQSKANTIEVAQNVKRVIKEMDRFKPPEVETRVAYDSSIFIERSINEVKQTLLIAGGLVVLVIFFFLRSVRSTIIPALAIPTSIITTFAFIYFFGFTINNLTLLALVLAIGLVVDDSIVVLENAYRHIEIEKEDPMKAARDGSSQVAFAVIATTLSLIAVFIPVAFLPGATGRLFFELGITVAIAVGVSSFVALTLIPMLCSRFLKHQEKHNAVYNVLESFFNGLSSIYRKSLTRVLHHRVIMSILGFLSLGLILYFGGVIRKEFLPVEDKGSFLVVTSAPDGSTLEYTDKYQLQAEAIVDSIPEIQTYFSAIGLSREGVGQPDSGIMFARLKPWEERERTQSEIVQSIQPALFSVPGFLAFPIEPPPLDTGGGFNQKVQYILQSGNLTELAEYTETMVGRLRGLPELVNVDSDLKITKPELKIRIDRNKAADLGISVREIATTLQVLFGGQDVTTFKREGEQYDVIVQLKRQSRFTRSDLEKIYIRTEGGREGAPLVQLSNIVSMEETVGPSQINHYNRIRSSTLRANLAPGVTLGEGLDAIDRVAEEILPSSFTTALAGESREFREGQSRLFFTFFLAIFMVYIVLASQFESFVEPLVILFSVPLAMIGALGTLWAAGMTLNLFSVIGLIMLIGLSTKNSILLIEFANQLRQKGDPLVEAVIEAGAIRLRPILMTAISTVFGILPIALGIGAGSQSRQPLGMAIVGGMIFSTLLTLYVVPVVFTLTLEGLQKLRGGKAS